MSKRVTNLIESILGSAAAAGTVAEAAEAAHAPKYDTTTPTTSPAGSSALASAAKGVVTGATASGKAKVQQSKLDAGRQKMIADAVRAQKAEKKKKKSNQLQLPPGSLD